MQYAAAPYNLLKIKAIENAIIYFIIDNQSFLLLLIEIRGLIIILLWKEKREKDKEVKQLKK